MPSGQRCASCSRSRCASPTRSPGARRSSPPSRARRPMRRRARTRRRCRKTRSSGPSRESTGATSWAATGTSSASAASVPGRRCRRPRSRCPRPRRWRERRRIENGFSQLGLPISPACEGGGPGMEVARLQVEGSRLPALRRGGTWMIALLIAAAVAQPGRDPTLLHRGAEPIVAAREQEQEATLRRMLELGGSSAEQAEVVARLAGLLRARGLALSIRAQAAADEGDETAAARDRRGAADARAEAIARYRELLKKYPRAPRLDEALFFLADTLQESGRDPEAVAAARELTRRFPRSPWAPSSHVFLGEHLFDAARLDEALKEYRAAAEVPTDDVYPYALYKAAWCRFNQNAFGDAMKLFKRVVEVSEKSGDVNTVQLAREARRDYVLAYGRSGRPETAKDEFARKFGAQPGLKMLEQYGKLLFDTGRDSEAQIVHRQLLALHGDTPAAVLDQTRLLVLAQRGGKRRELLAETRLLVETVQRVRARTGAGPGTDTSARDERYEEANRLGEETLRNLAVQIHNEARKTRLDETWAAARALYADYLTLFPKAADAYDLRFFYGELLYARAAKTEAADQYEQVVRHDLAAKKPGRWLQKAAWSAVLSRNEAMLHGAAEQKDTGERRAQRPLNAEEQKLAGACRLYLEALPEGPHAVEVAFKVGRLEYVSGDYAAAQKHLSWIALAHPEHELAEYAANLVLDMEIGRAHV